MFVTAVREMASRWATATGRGLRLARAEACVRCAEAAVRACGGDSDGAGCTVDGSKRPDARPCGKPALNHDRRSKS